MGYIDETWYVGSDGKYCSRGLSSPNAYLIPHLHMFSLANNKKGKYPEFCMGHIDEI